MGSNGAEVYFAVRVVPDFGPGIIHSYEPIKAFFTFSEPLMPFLNNLNTPTSNLLDYILPTCTLNGDTVTITHGDEPFPHPDLGQEPRHRRPSMMSVLLDPTHHPWNALVAVGTFLPSPPRQRLAQALLGIGAADVGWS
jgi:hypothetical protein